MKRVRLKLSSVSVDLQKNRIIDEISFTLHSGDIGCLLGPSGCGKTTLLRTIAGFEQPVSGSVELSGSTIADAEQCQPPEQRQIGMVFQDLALFPHLTVARNIAFGLQKQSRAKREARVRRMLELADMTDLSERYPHELSGGQQQRVSLIRAMAPEPELLLMDEPFSSQDTERRVQLAHEVRKILKHEEITAVLVTHDQREAFAIADVIGVMQDGHLRQWDQAFNLYHEPADRFVADFVGEGVFICGSTLDSHWIQTELGNIQGDFSESLTPGTQIDLLIRPDDVIHDDQSPNKGTVIARDFRGADHLYTLLMPGRTRLLCLAPSHHDHQLGEKIGVRLRLDHLVMFPRQEPAG